MWFWSQDGPTRACCARSPSVGPLTSPAGAVPARLARLLLLLYCRREIEEADGPITRGMVVHRRAARGHPGGVIVPCSQAEDLVGELARLWPLYPPARPPTSP